ncbi:hypothetical protein BV133_2832 [Blastochloris viridis]|uniref:Uncharacterized protein n=1 Tax=Blastochloris viridis TaxID=1079 RepID=A0A182D4S5_BLAVI|nr:hypothetical protein BV133_2832 [Blastochloris viridis]
MADAAPHARSRVFHRLEHSPQRRIPAFCEILNVTSKA